MLNKQLSQKTMVINQLKIEKLHVTFNSNYMSLNKMLLWCWHLTYHKAPRVVFCIVCTELPRIIVSLIFMATLMYPLPLFSRVIVDYTTWIFSLIFNWTHIFLMRGYNSLTHSFSFLVLLWRNLSPRKVLRRFYAVATTWSSYSIMWV